MSFTGYLLLNERTGKGICRFPTSLDVILKKEVTEFHPDKYLARAQGFAPEDLLCSVERGLRMAAELLFREGHCRQLMGVQIDLGLNEGECGAFNGRSADLAFALGVMAEIRGLDQPMAATGVLLDSGLVGRVSGVVEKLKAAADCLPPGSSLFYPGDNHRELEEEQRSSLQELQERGFTLVPVDSLEEVALELGIPVQGVWRSEPYKGLSRFDVIDKGIFFGRDGDSKRAVNKLHSRAEESCPGLMILSESGVGKSSFVRAGILASLHSEPGRQYVSLVFDERLFDAVDEREFCWRIVEPMGPEIREQAPESPPETLEAVAEWILELDLSRQPVLVFDQFEQLFAGNHTPDLVVRFAHLLLRLQKAGVWIIACMRSEFYPDYAGVKDEHGNALLLAVFGDSPAGVSGLFDLKPLSSELLRSVIQGPASLARVSFGFSNEGANLVDRIVADVGQHTDVLPLLEFLLERLYQQRDPETGTIAYEAYERIGGLSGALEQAAEEAVAGQPREVVEAVMRAMVQTSADHKELVLASSVDITHLDEASFEYQSIRALENARLLTVGASCGLSNKRSVRLVHEALISGWPRAAILFNDPKTLTLIRDRDRLRQRAFQWAESGYLESFLPSNVKDLKSTQKLKEKLSVLELDSSVHLYLEKARNFEKRLRLKKWSKSTIILSLFFSAFIFFGYLLAGQYENEYKAKYSDLKSKEYQLSRGVAEELKGKFFRMTQGIYEKGWSGSPVDQYLYRVSKGIDPSPFKRVGNRMIYKSQSFLMDEDVFSRNERLITLIFRTSSMLLPEKMSWISKIKDGKLEVSNYAYRLTEILENEFNNLYELEFDLAKEIFSAYKKNISKWRHFDQSNRQRYEMAESKLPVFLEARRVGFASEIDVFQSYLDLIWHAILLKKIKVANSYIERAQENNITYTPLLIKYAHVLALQGKVKESIAIYKRNYGTNFDAPGSKSLDWEDVVLDDFNSLRSSGIDSPVFNIIEGYYRERVGEF